MKKEFENIARMILELDQKTEQGFEAMDRKTMQGFEAMDGKIDHLEHRIDGMEKFVRDGFETMNDKIDVVQEQVEAAPQRMQGLENRMDREHERSMDERYAFEQKMEKRIGAFEAKFKAA